MVTPQTRLPRLLPALFLPYLVLAAAAGCADDADADATADVASPALVCDWLNARVDLIDLAELRPGATREDVLVRSLDLSDYAQVPLNAELTPDGKLALISLSDGFFGLSPLAGTLVGASDIPSGNGRVLFVDMERFEVVGEVETGDGPMGIGMLRGGSHAVVAHFGSNSLAIVDVDARSLASEVEVGIYSEEIAIDDSGEVGIVSYSAAGNVRTFGTEDVGASLSDGIELTGDAAGVAFFPGTKTAYVVQSPMPLTGAQGGYNVVDVSDPSAPVVLDELRDPNAAIVYPAAPAPGRGTVVVPTAQGNMLGLDEIALENDGTASTVQSLVLGDADLLGAYGVVVDGGGRALLSVPSKQRIVVVDLDSGEHFNVQWDGGLSGPMDIAIVPN